MQPVGQHHGHSTPSCLRLEICVGVRFRSSKYFIGLPSSTLAEPGRSRCRDHRSGCPDRPAVYHCPPWHRKGPLEKLLILRHLVKPIHRACRHLLLAAKMVQPAVSRPGRKDGLDIFDQLGPPADARIASGISRIDGPLGSFHYEAETLPYGIIRQP